MKIIRIDINRSEVEAELSRITAYTGVKGTPGGSVEEVDRIATVDADSALLHRYWHNAAGILAEQLKEFITSADTGGSEMKITLEVSGAYDDSLTPSVKEGLFSFVVSSMAKRWFLITCPEKAAEWDAESTRLLREIASKLYFRRKPKRKSGG